MTNEEILATPLTEVEMSIRAFNCLDSAGIKTIGELVQKSERDIYHIRNMGKKTLKELREIVSALNLQFEPVFRLQEWRGGLWHEVPYQPIRGTTLLERTL